MLSSVICIWFYDELYNEKEILICRKLFFNSWKKKKKLVLSNIAIVGFTFPTYIWLTNGKVQKRYFYMIYV